MIQVKTVGDVYAAVDELVAELKDGPLSQLADVLHHRMHTVSWTSGSELLEELQTVLGNALRSGAPVPRPVRTQIKQMLAVIKEALAFS